MKKTIAICALLLTGITLQAQCGPFTFPSFTISPEEQDSFKQMHTGPTFQLSQDYPARNTVNAGSLPFSRIDFTKDSEKYATALINWALEGMSESGWVVQNNKSRKWYHAPWMDATKIGREPISGLVMQRGMIPTEISGNLPEGQLTKNYAISLYNEAGAYTIGQVWCDPKNPDPSKGVFPVGTVKVQLVFTVADSSLLPQLKGAPALDAWIDPVQGENKNKGVHKVYLMQVDIAVKTDNPAAKTGWVFVSYFYDQTKNGTTVAERFWPIGVQWGQDPGITDREVNQSGTALKEQWINTTVFKEADRTKGAIKHLGWGNRLASPIDHASSSCMSCHSTAGYPMKMALVAPENTPADSMLKWFRNLKAPETFVQGQVSLDYCMELAAGIRNFYDAQGKFAGDIVFRGSLTDLNALFTPLKDPSLEKVEIEPGLSTPRRTAVFITFMTLIAALSILLIYNLMRKN